MKPKTLLILEKAICEKLYNLGQEAYAYEGKDDQHLNYLRVMDEKEELEQLLTQIRDDEQSNLNIHSVVGSYSPTKREYFIAKAMQGILSGRIEHEDPTHNAVKYAVEVADGILEQL
jgi:hypothetical protein